MFHEYQAHDIAVYGGYLENDNELLECTSGGIATAISKYMLSLGGLVAGVSYSKDFYAAQYEIIDRESQLDRFKGSKYVEVQKGKIYRDVKDLLDRGKSVLFFGLPCSVAALNTFLGGEYDGLITCELVCQGPTSPKVHVEYIQYLEKKFGSKIVDFSVRQKKDAWLPSYLHARFQNGQIFEKRFHDTEYGYAFRVLGRPSCYHCQFKGNHRTADIMIGDFWGAEKGDSFWNDKGVSVIFAHTEKGKKFLEKTPGIRLYPTDFEKAVANNQMVIRARKVSPEREKFEKLFAEKGLIYAARRSKSLKTRMELFAIRVIPPQIRTFLRKGYCQIKNKISPPDSNSQAAEKKAS